MPRRPIKRYDPYPVIVKRTRFIEKHIRPILYGTFPEKAPMDCTGAIHKKTGKKLTQSAARRMRVSTWGWKIREFVMLRAFRYVDLRQQALAFVAKHGPWKDCTLAGDLELFIAWHTQVSEVRTRLKLWKNQPSETSTLGEIAESKIASETKNALRVGVCPLCGFDLPCSVCKVPNYLMDGRGGIYPDPNPKWKEVELAADDA